MRVIGIAGSLRTGSFNRMLLRQAIRLAPSGMAVERWDSLREVPPFCEDDEETPARPVRALRTAIAGADAVLIATPEYNGSIPGQLKNALDWASRPYPDNVLRDKPTAVIGASPSPSGAARSQGEIREVLRRTGARVLDREVSIANAYEQFDAEGQLQDAGLRAELRRLLEDLAVFSGADTARPALAGRAR
jgi:chromate reductase, NAD(P)H dehydrogenase (quinone)